GRRPCSASTSTSSPTSPRRRETTSSTSRAPGTNTSASLPSARWVRAAVRARWSDRKSTRLNSSHVSISYAVFCLKKKKNASLRFGRRVHRRQTKGGGNARKRRPWIGSIQRDDADAISHDGVVASRK